MLCIVNFKCKRLKKERKKGEKREGIATIIHSYNRFLIVWARVNSPFNYPSIDSIRFQSNYLVKSINAHLILRNMLHSGNFVLQHRNSHSILILSYWNN